MTKTAKAKIRITKSKADALFTLLKRSAQDYGDNGWWRETCELYDELTGYEDTASHIMKGGSEP